MSDRREVNVERPEHSWIPFYRELAEKLVNDGWRERQGELVEDVEGDERRGREDALSVEMLSGSIRRSFYVVRNNRSRYDVGQHWPCTRSIQSQIRSRRTIFPGKSRSFLSPMHRN